MEKTIVKKYLLRGHGAHPDEISHGESGSKLLLETTYMQTISSPATARAADINLHDRAIVYEYFNKDGSQQPHSQVTAMLDTAVIRYLEGKFLTYAEATFTDMEQREAHKSLIRNLLWDTYNKFETGARNLLDDAVEVEAKTI